VANGAAIQFALQMLTDGSLRSGFDQAVQKMSAAEPPDIRPVMHFLAQNKVAATPLQVSRALSNVAGRDITQWVNTFGDTTIAKGSDSFPGPTLIVTGEFISLDKHRVISPSYDE